jgi:hypothetical protein
MKTHFYLLPLFATRLIAAEPSAPAAPFVPQIPNNSSLTIRIKNKNDTDDKAATEASAGQAGAMGGGKAVVLTQIQIDKSAKNRRIQRKWSGKKTDEVWWLGHLCLAEFPNQEGTTEISVIDSSSVNGAIVDTGRVSATLSSGGDYVKGDFPELSWIEPDMRVGNETKNEVEFHVYRMTGSVAPTKTKVDMTMPGSLKNAKSPDGDKAAPAPAKVTVTTVKEAWINASTKLPSKLIDGEQTWTYSYSSEPPNLTLPPEYIKALQDYKAALEESKVRRLR